MPAGYVRVWLSTEEAIDHVIRVDKCSREEAREALAQAIHDEELGSRFAENRVTKLFQGALIDLKALLETSVRDPEFQSVSGELAARMLLPKRRPAVEINRKDLERLWPSPRASELVQPAPAARLAARPPSREKPFWSAARNAAFKWLVENGCPSAGDGQQAALEKCVADWLENHGHEASESSIRRHVVRWIKERRAELELLA